jgi:adenylate kinase
MTLRALILELRKDVVVNAVDEECVVCSDLKADTHAVVRAPRRLVRLAPSWVTTDQDDAEIG